MFSKRLCNSFEYQKREQSFICCYLLQINVHTSHSLGRSTGFVLEGFPSNTDEVEYLLQQQLFPDLVLIMEANIVEVQKRLLPSYLDQWRKWQRHLEEQIVLLRQLRLKNRVRKTLHSTSLTVSGSVAL